MWGFCKKINITNLEQILFACLAVVLIGRASCSQKDEALKDVLRILRGQEKVEILILRFSFSEDGKVTFLADGINSLE